MTPPLIEFQNVSVQRGARIALREISLRIEAGEHVAILGPNGCGKSTLIKTIARECYPLFREGCFVRIFGQETWNIFDLRPLIGIVSDDLATICSREITGREVALSGFFGSIGIWPNHKVTTEMRSKVEEVLEFLEGAHLADREMTEMSSGEARRMLIARALVHEPRALLLDEPSNSLDLRAQYELKTILRKLAASGRGIVLVTHHLDDIIPEIERVILLRSGEIVADGSARDLLTQASVADLFGLPLEAIPQHWYAA